MCCSSKTDICRQVKQGKRRELENTTMSGASPIRGAAEHSTKAENFRRREEVYDVRSAAEKHSQISEQEDRAESLHTQAPAALFDLHRLQTCPSCTPLYQDLGWLVTASMTPAEPRPPLADDLKALGLTAAMFHPGLHAAASGGAGRRL